MNDIFLAGAYGEHQQEHFALYDAICALGKELDHYVWSPHRELVGVLDSYVHNRVQEAAEGATLGLIHIGHNSNNLDVVVDILSKTDTKRALLLPNGLEDPGKISIDMLAMHPVRFSGVENLIPKLRKAIEDYYG